MKRITVAVDPDDYAAFDMLARTSEVSASWLICRLMCAFRDRHAKKDVVQVTLGPMKRAS